jgi:hypothetical protein
VVRSFYLARSSQTRHSGLIWLEIVVGLASTSGLLFMQYTASERADADLIEVRKCRVSGKRKTSMR